MEISQKIRASGIKATPQRRAIYAMLQKMGHSSVEEMVSEISQISPCVTVSTVYNVMDCLAKVGLISRLSTPQGKLYYDINITEHHHIVGSDGKVTDFDAPELTQLINNYLAHNPVAGHHIAKVSLQLYETNDTQPDE
ncbi:MAG: transcriptional repressor [Mucinivorans sp.]